MVDKEILNKIIKLAKIFGKKEKLNKENAFQKAVEHVAYELALPIEKSNQFLNLFKKLKK